MIGCLSGLFGVTFPNHPINRHMISINASMKLGLIMFQEFYSDSAWVRCWWWPPVLWCSPNSAFYRDWLSWIHLSFLFRSVCSDLDLTSWKSLSMLYCFQERLTAEQCLLHPWMTDNRVSKKFATTVLLDKRIFDKYDKYSAPILSDQMMVPCG